MSQPSRYASQVVVTAPLNYKDPYLASDSTAAPDAKATGDGLAIQGSLASLKAGTKDPNGRVKGYNGSIYLRVGDSVEYSAYLKESDNGGPTGWFPIATIGGKASTAAFTFGLENDTVGSNACNKYGNVLKKCSLLAAMVSCVTPPSTADMILDIKYSSDGGETWWSVFAPGSDSTGDGEYLYNRIVFPINDADPNVFNYKYIVYDQILTIDDLVCDGSDVVTSEKSVFTRDLIGKQIQIRGGSADLPDNSWNIILDVPTPHSLQLSTTITSSTDCDAVITPLNKRWVPVTAFTVNPVYIPDNSLLRMDCLQSGGATGISVSLYTGPKYTASISNSTVAAPGDPPPSVIPTGGGGGVVTTSDLYVYYFLKSAGVNVKFVPLPGQTPADWGLTEWPT